MLHIKHRITHGGKHIHAMVYLGPDADHLQLSGTITFTSTAEWLQWSEALNCAMFYNYLTLLPTNPPPDENSHP